MDMEGENIHQRVLKLGDVALGSKKAVSLSSSLAPASYDSAVDSLLALYCECKSASSLAKDKNVLKFINKCEYTGGCLHKQLNEWCIVHREWGMACKITPRCMELLHMHVTDHPHARGMQWFCVLPWYFETMTPVAKQCNILTQNIGRGRSLPIHNCKSSEVHCKHFG